MSGRRLWLIAYDVREPRRLGRLHRRVAESALRIQYSVYLFEGTQHTLRRLLEEIEAEIEPTEDDVRAYPVPVAPDLHVLGRGAGTPGVAVFGTANALLALLQRSGPGSGSTGGDRA